MRKQVQRWNSKTKKWETHYERGPSLPYEVSSNNEAQRYTVNTLGRVVRLDGVGRRQTDE